MTAAQHPDVVESLQESICGLLFKNRLLRMAMMEAMELEINLSATAA
jgi:hypothetical protein